MAQETSITLMQEAQKLLSEGYRGLAGDVAKALSWPGGGHQKWACRNWRQAVWLTEFPDTGCRANCSAADSAKTAGLEKKDSMMASDLKLCSYRLCG